ncbi:MAG: rhodanese-like domain-containing protein [Candidatus Thiodiazotropha sp.]|nr:rhodanese-like domain-containing protein [Candidatus Thiodiazotropha sp.]MCM8882311.1 rhodanese-like domain-containing protein [Candidatus Thiodiazotropha sp.]
MGMTHTRIGTSILATLVFTISISVNYEALSAEGDSDGNRYYLQRYYLEDISAAKAYLGMLGKHQDKDREKHEEKKHDFDKLTIIDVSDATEYRMGHPKKAIHMPYPRIYRECVDNLRTEDGACSAGLEQSIKSGKILNRCFCRLKKKSKIRPHLLQPCAAPAFAASSQQTSFPSQPRSVI